MKKILSVFLCLTVFLTYISVFAEISTDEEISGIEQVVETDENITNQPINAEQNLSVEENTEAVSDNEPDFKKELRSFFDGKLDEIKNTKFSNTSACMVLFGKSPKYCLDEAYYIDTRSGAIDFDEQTNALYNFTEKVFDMLIEGAVESSITNEEKYRIIADKTSEHSYVEMAVGGTGVSYRFIISDNHWFYDTHTFYTNRGHFAYGNYSDGSYPDEKYAQCYDLTNVEEIIEYITSAYDNELSDLRIYRGAYGGNGHYNVEAEDKIRATADYENQMFYYVELSSKYKLLDKLSFNITLDESWRDSPLEEIAGPNGVVKCTIENLHTGRMHLVLTFEGKYGKKQYFQMDIVTGFSTSSRWLYFTTDSVVEDNKFIQLKARRGFSNDVIFFSGGYNNLTLSWYYHSEGQGGYSISDKGIEPRYGHPQIIESPNPLKCTDMKYEFYGSEKSFEGNNNLNRYLSLPASYEEYAASLGIELEDEEEQSEEQQTEQKEQEEKQDEKDAELKGEQAEIAEKTSEELAEELHSLGLLEGTGEGYELEKSFTREQAAAIIVRFVGEEENVLNSEYTEAFSDVAKERWSYPYIMYCYENGITKGTGNGKFSPEDEIPATQFITLILRLLGHTQAEPKTAFDLAVEHKLLDLEKANELKEKKEFLRGDMVYVMYQTLGK